MFTGHHHHHIDKLFHLKDRLGHLYEHLLIQAFAVSLISIFIPIYLLTLGFSLSKVLIFLLIEWTVFGLFSPIYGKILHNVGLKEVIFIRTPIFAIALLLLSFMKNSLFLQQNFYIVAILNGFAGAIYTLSITSLFADYLGKKKQSEKTGTFIALPKIASIFGPVLGGFIASFFGFPILFIIVMILLFFSLIPLSFVKKNIDHPPFDIKIFKNLKSDFKEFLMLGSFGMQGFVLFIILPLAIFLQSNNSFSLGIIVSIISFISALFTIYLGFLTEKFGIKKMLKFGAVITSLLFFVLGYFLHLNMLLFLSLISGFVSVLIGVPYETHLYSKSRKYASPLVFLVFKEFSLYFGRLILFGLLIILGSNLASGFYLGSAASLGFVFF